MMKKGYKDLTFCLKAECQKGGAVFTWVLYALYQ